MRIALSCDKRGHKFRKRHDVLSHGSRFKRGQIAGPVFRLLANNRPRIAGGYEDRVHQEPSISPVPILEGMNVGAREMPKDSANPRRALRPQTISKRIHAIHERILRWRNVAGTPEKNSPLAVAGKIGLKKTGRNRWRKHARIPFGDVSLQLYRNQKSPPACLLLRHVYLSYFSAW